MSSRFDLTRRRRLPLLAAIAIAMVGACNADRTAATGEGSPPQATFFIGPQPGPDRALVSGANPYAGDRTAMRDGRQLFKQYNCAGCHGDHAGGGMGPSLRDTLWYYGGDEASIFASVTEGRQHGMPAWGSKLPRDQIWKIVAYIKSLRTPDEPEPPR
jgi:cytochrome c oxidase cbb3-type subunit 3